MVPQALPPPRGDARPSPHLPLLLFVSDRSVVGRTGTGDTDGPFLTRYQVGCSRSGVSAWSGITISLGFLLDGLRG